MDQSSIMPLLHLYLSRKKRLNYDMFNIRMESQRLVRKCRRNIMLQNKLLLVLMMLIDKSFEIHHRFVWCWKKNDKWWSEVVPLMTDQQFKQNFRLERSTFLALLRYIGPELEKKNTKFRATIPVEKRICCALYILGSSSELRTVGHLFGIGKSTAGKLLHDFCQTLVNLFFHRFVQFPYDNQEIESTINGFLDKFGYPMCLGAVDGTHLSIQAPFGYQTDYFNYKKFYSIIMLAVANSNLLFSYINIGAPGRCNDSSIYAGSHLSQVIQSPIYQNYSIMVNNVKIQSHLIADSAFALNKTLMKPYPERPDMPKHYSLFNYRLSRARCCVERAFGSFKNRFRLLNKKMEFDLCNVTNIIKAAVILHNLCVINGDRDEIEWNIPVTLLKRPLCNTQTNDGKDIRDALTNFFLQNPL